MATSRLDGAAFRILFNLKEFTMKTKYVKTVAAVGLMLTSVGVLAATETCCGSALDCCMKMLECCM
jgi:hypothetical protein